MALGDLYVAAAQVMTQNGDTANAAVLNNIAANIGPHAPISVGSLISATSGGGAAETATINALDLVTGSAFVANGASGLSIPNLATNLALLGTGLTTSVNVTQSPQLACGRVGVAKASTAQIQVGVKGRLASVPALPTSLLGINASVVADSTEITVGLAKASGTLTKVVCGAATPASPEGIDVSVGSQVGSVTTLNQRLSVNGNLGGGILGGLLGGLLGSILNVSVSGYVDLRVTTPPDTQTRTAVLRIPNSPATYATPVSTGTGSLGLNGANVTSTSHLVLSATGLLGLNINMNLSQITALTDKIVAGLVSNVANPLITRLNDTLVTPLSNLLGLELGGADVFAMPRPHCSEPALRG